VKLLQFFRGTPQVFVQEFLGNLKSVRFVIMALVAALVIVGGAFGISGFTGGFTAPPLVVWGHPAFDTGGDHVAVAWVADPFGGPLADQTVTFGDNRNGTTIGTVRTDGSGFARLNVGNISSVFAGVRLGTFDVGVGIAWEFLPPFNFTVSQSQSDLDGDGAFDDLSLHALNLTGDPVPGTVSVNGPVAGNLDSHGFIHLELPPGESNVSLVIRGEAYETVAYVPEDGGPAFLSGPDFVLLIISAFSSLIVSIFAIVISFDAVSKERILGTMDLLLSRPASRTGVLLGKFLASFAAVAVPVTLVNLAGIAAISAASGRGPTGSFAAAFVGYSLLLIVYYVLLQIALSTLAKTSGNAVLFGILIWLLLNILYPIVTFILAAILSAGDPAAQFRIAQYLALGNPTSIVSGLISLAAPVGFSGPGGTALDAATLGAAGVLWLILLLVLALWVFERKAAA